MVLLLPLVNLCLLSSFIAITQAADCDQNQQRQAGDPSGKDIDTALTKDNQLATVCSGEFPPGNDRIATYNHWSMIYNVTRTDPNQGLQGCLDGFQNIIDQCISGDNYWGGTWSLNGFTYAIYNQAYPSNGLGPNDSGGPSSTDDSNPRTTDEPESTTADLGVTTTSGGDRATDAPPTTAAPSVPGETIVTETNSDGAPITATVSQPPCLMLRITLIVAKFAPTTLSQYATLKSETTITTTITRNGVPIIFPLVIGAGGVAWGKNSWIFGK